MSTGHQSPQSNLQPLAVKLVNTLTWGAGGNTCTITDPYVRSNSFFDYNVTGSTPQAGIWAIQLTATTVNSSGTVVPGTIVITSSNSESSSLTISYILL